MCAIAAVGVWRFSPHRLEPLADQGLGGLILGAASIFVAYEGFELLAYDYDDIDNPKRTLPRALYLSVVVVAAVYILVTLGSQMLVSDSLIVSQKEVAFATVGREAFGSLGLWIATLGALLATCSAINATLFATARQMRDLADANELPGRLDRQVNGLPIAALALLTVLGCVFAMLPGILEAPRLRVRDIPRRLRVGEPSRGAGRADAARADRRGCSAAQPASSRSSRSPSNWLHTTRQRSP